MKRILVVVVFAVLASMISGCQITGNGTSDNEKVDYEKAMSETGTYDDCTYFLDTYPESKHFGEVMTKAEGMANKDNEKYKTTAPELTEAQINQLTMDLLQKFEDNKIDQVIIYPYSYKLKIPKNWLGQSIKNQKDNFIDKIGKKLDTEFSKFVINQANCGIPERSNLNKIVNEMSKLLDDKYSQEDAVKKLGHIEVADAFIFLELDVEAIDKKILEKPFLTGTCHQVEFSYTITAKLVPVGSASTTWLQSLEFKHNTYIWNSTAK